MRERKWAAIAAGVCLAGSGLAALSPGIRNAPAPAPAAGIVREADLRQYLTYLSSDELLGREVFTEGYGIASEYVAETLKSFGVKPLGDHGTYFQMVRYNDVKVTADNTSVTVTVNGASKTFRNGEGVEFARPVGGKQTLTFADATFLNYALFLNDHDDYKGKNVRGKAVIWSGTTPAGLPLGASRIVSTSARARHLLQETFAGASIAYSPTLSTSAPGTSSTGSTSSTSARAPVPPTYGPRPTAARGDFRTVENFARMNPPQLTGGDDFFAFLLSGTPGQFDAFKAAASSGAALPAISLAGVKLSFNIDATYQVLGTQLTRNVVGMVEGTDPALKSTYVMYGAHLDHVGMTADTAARGRVNNPIETDKIWNGADDDGSGSAGLLGIAKAFATGPKPKRSIVFVWHAGEEAGLLGSRYNADFPVVPLDKVIAQLNIDMIGRDRDNDPKYANTVFVIGADRISTDLHNAVVHANSAQPKPITLDFEYNDPTDPETFYYRSDHFSYAAKDVPIAFFFTGTHPDYHANSDSVEKIRFDKMQRIAQMVYQAGFDVANNPKAPVKDHLGPRAGKGFVGMIK